MYITVRLLTGFSKPLSYKIPDDLAHISLQGAIVQVPIRSRTVYALVEKQFEEFDVKPEFTIKTAHKLIAFPQDKHFMRFLEQLSGYYCIDKMHFIKRISAFLSKEKEQVVTSDATEKASTTELITLTDEQQVVVDYIEPQITNNVYAPTLVHGITGSGKTEVYAQAIRHTLSLNKSVIIMLPEVTLALRFEEIFRSKLPENTSIYSFHSASPAATKRALWHALINKKPCVIIGVHLPILLPIPNLGLIVIDEEHEVGYQEKQHPRVNTKEAAIFRARQHSIPILFGSATPSITSLYNVKANGWKFFQLTKRYRGALPTIKTVSLTDRKQRKNFWISTELYNALRDRLEKKEQSIIFINRRGFSFFMQCKTCSFIFECKSCSVSLTLHADERLSCHYCGYAEPMPTACTPCKGTKLLKKGIGTQQIVTILEKLFPEARIARADMDSTVNKKHWQKTLDDFQAGDIDILVGTQTITKGYHFPKVTLVGIIWADLNLHHPVYNAAETTLQQLLQVAGRAGREQADSLVIAQCMDEHSLFSYLDERSYLQFYEEEVINRAELSYPPLGRLAEIELVHADEDRVHTEAQNLTRALIQQTKTIQVLGPALPPVAKLKNRHRRRIYLKSANMQAILALYRTINQSAFSSRIYFTPQPL